MPIAYQGKQVPGQPGFRICPATDVRTHTRRIPSRSVDTPRSRHRSRRSSRSIADLDDLDDLDDLVQVITAQAIEVDRSDGTCPLTETHALTPQAGGFVDAGVRSDDGRHQHRSMPFARSNSSVVSTVEFTMST